VGLVRQFGADTVIDYMRERLASALAGYDGVLDLIGGETLDQAFGVVRPGSPVVCVGGGMPEPQTASKDLGRGIDLQALFWVASLSLRRRARRHGVHYRFFIMHPSGEDLSELARLVDAGAIKVVLDSVYPCMIVSDNGTELTSNAILAWQQQRGVEWHYIAPGQTDAEWLRRELQRPAARRMSQRASVRQPQGGA
jgi:Zinc-binding dehydrogenase